MDFSGAVPDFFVFSHGWLLLLLCFLKLGAVLC